MGKLIATAPGRCVYDDTSVAFGLRIYQTAPNEFTVVYGLQIRDGLNWREAAHEIGECLFHALECDGKIDRSDGDEE